MLGYITREKRHKRPRRPPSHVMGLKYNSFFEDNKYETSDSKIITCKHCLTHLCLLKFVISDSFSGLLGKAYLVEDLINYEFYQHLEKTPMRTGLYQIHKVRCHTCELPLGWYYKKAYSSTEEYKEGKFVIENEYLRFLDNPTLTRELVNKAVMNRLSRKESFSSIGTASLVGLPPLIPRCPYYRKDSGLMGYGFHGLSYTNMVRWKSLHHKKDCDFSPDDDDDEVFVDV